MLTAIMAVGLLCPPAQAIEGEKYRNYEVYYDQNGDIILLAPPTFIFIGSDVVTPLNITANNGHFKLVYDKYSQKWKLIPLSKSAIEKLSLRPNHDYELDFRDLDGDGVLDLLLRHRKATSDSFSITKLHRTASLSIYNANDNGIDLPDDTDGTDGEFLDVNGDGIADIINGDTTYLGTKSGKPISLAPLDRVLQRGTEVGLGAGEFKVTESGAATYTIPINVPAGTAGVAPQLALSYSSMSGESIMGVGWNISGMSAITRCPKSIVHDNYIKGVQFDNTDAFCLNGQRLKATYGKANTFHTDIDDFSVIKMVKSSGYDGPRYFTVTTKANETHYYGAASQFSNSDDAYVERGGFKARSAAKTWALKAIVDNKGNYIEYRYSKTVADGQHYLKEVLYGGNKPLAQSHYNKVVFNYGTNARPFSGYANGGRILGNKSLANVKVYQDSEVFRHYKLQWSGEGKLPEERNYVTGIQECFDSTALQCLPATHFEYEHEEKKGASQTYELCTKVRDDDGTVYQNCTRTNHCSPANNDALQYCKVTHHNAPSFKLFNYKQQSIADSSSDRAYAQIFDFNGDGFADIVQPKKGRWYAHASKWNIETKNQNNISYEGSKGILKGVNTPRKVRELERTMQTHVLTNSKVGEKQYVKIIDFDGDGKQELLIPIKNGNWHILSSDPSVRMEEHCVRPEDRYAQADDDFENCTTSRVDQAFTYRSLNIKATDYKNAIVADVDGDGLQDIVFKSGGLKYYKNIGGRFSRAQSIRVTYEDGFDSNDFGSAYNADFTKSSYSFSNSALIDINGDGLTDIIMRATKMVILPPDNPYCQDQASNRLRKRYQAALFLDECRQRVEYKSRTYAYTAKVINGQVTYHAYRDSHLGGSLSSLRVADFNGDGLTDIAFRLNNNWYYRLSRGDGSFTYSKILADLNGSDEKRYNRHVFIDIDGDGRTDILEAQKSASFNILLSAPSNTPDSLNIQRRGSINIPGDVNKVSVRFADVDGDTKLDLLTADSDSGKWKLQTSVRAHIKDHVITKITNGFGVETEIAYAPLNSGIPLLNVESRNKPARDNAQFSDYLTPFAGYFVVSEAATQSSNGISTRSNLVQYAYGGPLAHKKGHGFLGFETLQTTDPQSNVVTTTQYHQLYPKAGMPKSTIKRYGDLLLSKASNEYTVTTSAQGGKQVYLKKTIEDNYAIDLSVRGNTPANHKKTDRVITSNTYDNWGNLATNDVEIRDVSNSKVHETRTTNKYESSAYRVIDSANTSTQRLKYASQIASQYSSSASPNAVQFGRLSETTVTKTRYRNTASGGSESQTRVSNFSYYQNGLLRESSVNGLNTAYFYDKYGNKVAQQLAGNKGKNSAAGKDYRSSYISYDSRGQYIASKTNHNGDKESYLYNGQSADGIIQGRIYSKTTTGPNNLATTTYLDVQGQAVKQVMADGNYIETVKAFSTEKLNSYLKEVVSSSNKPTKTSYYDRYGRKVQETSTVFDDEVHTRSKYDYLGRVTAVSIPSKRDGSFIYTTRDYDALGRVYREVSPAESGVSSVLTQINGLKTVTYDEKGYRYDDVYSADGKLVERIDPENQTINYYYDAYGNSTKVVTRAENQKGALQSQVITTSYDSYGRKLQTNDPDKGNWRYDYNSFGELVEQTDAKQQTIVMNYDSMGRMVSRKDNTSLSCWTYGNDASLYNRGKPLAVKQWSALANCNTQVKPQYAERYYYDDYGRPNKTDFVIGANQYQTRIEYNALGQISRQHYPTSNADFYVDYEYNDNYFLSKQIDNRGKTLRTIEAMDAFGNITNQSFGNGTSESKVFSENTGRIASIDVDKSNGDYIHQLSYGEFDKKGNVTRRSHSYYTGRTLKLGFAEEFGYDKLNRMTSRALELNQGSLNPYGQDSYVERYAYDGFGNIKSKQYDGVSSKHGNYQYVTSGSVNRLDSAVVDGKQYSKFRYDNNGNTVSDGSRSFTYNGFDKVSRIQQGTQYTEYRYNHQRAVYQRTDYRQDENIWKRYNTDYVGGIYQKEQRYKDSTLENTKHKYFIGNIIVERNQSAKIGLSENTQYLHNDHQGSVLSITNQSGNVLEQYFYTAFGKPMKLQGESLVQARLPMARGYTGHEMLPSLDIVQMGGRIYDPNLARFLQADPFIQAPRNLQNYNRYSYVLNNPFTYTDPSGYFLSNVFKPFKKLVRGVIRAAAKVFGAKFVNWVGTAISTYFGGPAGAAAWTYEFNRAMGASSTGALRAAVGAYITTYIGGKNFNNPVKHFIANATAGGVSAKLQGGNFGNGFWSAGLNSAVGGGNYTGNPVVNVVIAAAIGGTISEITGGKFSNGAYSAAFHAILQQDWEGSEDIVEGSPEWEAREEKYFQMEQKQMELAWESGEDLYAYHDPGWVRIQERSMLDNIGGQGTYNTVSSKASGLALKGALWLTPYATYKFVGLSFKFMRYRNAGGFGFTWMKNGKRIFGIDKHPLTKLGYPKNTWHVHYGKTRSQISKHRPYQGGWKW